MVCIRQNINYEQLFQGYNIWNSFQCKQHRQINLIMQLKYPVTTPMWKPFYLDIYNNTRLCCTKLTTEGMGGFHLKQYIVCK